MKEPGLNNALLDQFFALRGWVPYTFQKDVWRAVLNGEHGLLNAPTGSGKTLALALPFILTRQKIKGLKGVRMIWITPVRALSSEICRAMQEAIKLNKGSLTVAVRTGDTPAVQRRKIQTNPPDILITTPETLHIMLSSDDWIHFFSQLECVVTDEWHDLLSTKRGVQLELALAALKSLRPVLQIWGISATIGNMDQALEVLTSSANPDEPRTMVRTDLEKNIQVQTLYPELPELLSWAGHLGISLAPDLIPIIEQAQSTLLFTNTRSQAENWFQTILDLRPEWAGEMGLHHGSLDKKIRQFVEKSIHENRLKLVVCTSSLDLGVDFKPVDQIIQVGSPKNVSRFAQRAGRSGHAPGAISKICFVPTNSWELVESVAFQKALHQTHFEKRIPLEMALDVLIQFLLTLSCGTGFHPEEWYKKIKKVWSFKKLDRKSWFQCLDFIQFGGSTLEAYPQFAKVGPVNEGIWKMKTPKQIREHRTSIGTIATDFSMRVKLMRGKMLGTIEEDFIRRLPKQGRFTFAGLGLQLMDIKGQDALVQKLSKPEGLIPSWSGGRMPLSGEVSWILRETIDEFIQEGPLTEEMHFIEPMLRHQQEVSHLPGKQEILAETWDSKEGHHLFIYPFEGRLVHEGLAMLFAYRISKNRPAHFSIAMNDYGFELLSDEPFPIPSIAKLLDETALEHDLQLCNNYSELSKKKFRDIATISGLVQRPAMDSRRGASHLQSTASLFFKAFQDYDPQHILLRQSLEETLNIQLEMNRLKLALDRMREAQWIFKKLYTPSPLCFPIMVDRLREKHSNESVENSVKKLLGLPNM